MQKNRMMMKPQMRIVLTLEVPGFTQITMVEGLWIKEIKTFRSDPIKSLSGGQFSPIPKGLMDMMEQLNMQKKHMQNSPYNQQSNEMDKQQMSGTEAELSMYKVPMKRKSTLLLELPYPLIPIRKLF